MAVSATSIALSLLRFGLYCCLWYRSNLYLKIKNIYGLALLIRLVNQPKYIVDGHIKPERIAVREVNLTGNGPRLFNVYVLGIRKSALIGDLYQFSHHSFFDLRLFEPPPEAGAADRLLFISASAFGTLQIIPTNL